MKKILFHNPGVSTLNLGDQIISEAAKIHLAPLVSGAFCVDISTHLPQSLYYTRLLSDFDHKFVLGSNLLKSTFFGFKSQFDIGLLNWKFSGPAVLVGVGWWQYKNPPNFYTKLLLKSLLSKNFVHSVRDNFTKETLSSIGFENVLNTGCPTMWGLGGDHCSNINKEKNKNVVFTLTDYSQHEENDSEMVKALLSNYNSVYFWPQGVNDIRYLSSLRVNVDQITIISPDLQSFDRVLNDGQVDYVGTRLHAGIRALQKSVRTLIVAVDNRALEKKHDFGLPVICRNDVNNIGNFINDKIFTEIRLPEKQIAEWKAQFGI